MIVDLLLETCRNIQINVDKQPDICILMFMSKETMSSSSLPSDAFDALSHLGENIKIARKRRHKSLREWAGMMHVSIPTIQRMEKGDPSVGIGIYMTALSIIGMTDDILKVAQPENDTYALQIEVMKVLL